LFSEASLFFARLTSYAAIDAARSGLVELRTPVLCSWFPLFIKKDQVSFFTEIKVPNGNEGSQVCFLLKISSEIFGQKSQKYSNKDHHKLGNVSGK